jgi:2-dehydro-3-deoxyphosphogluconate aldolase/(4S)-4-hydroxy-2-oxoglutarate aldolase
MSILTVFRSVPVIPVLTLEKLEHGVPLARALVRGGLRVLEITLRTEVTFDVIRDIKREVPEAVVGIGTLRRQADFERAEQVGVQFGVSPGLTPEMVKTSRRMSFSFVPGVMTPSEVMTAHAAGFGLLKFFPAEAAGGLAMLKAMAAPLPDVVFCPTGGITPSSAGEYLALSNVVCVGGSWLAPRQLLMSENWTAIEALAREAAASSSRHRP